MDRGDRGNKKGFYVIDSTGKDFSEKFIENTYSPKHLLFDIIDILKLNTSEIKELFRNNFIDIKIESSFSKKFPISRFTEMVSGFGHRRLEFLSYSVNQIKNKSEIEINSNYEYNIFTILEEKIKELNYSNQFSKEIIENFKRVYDTLRNTKSYEQ